jgi:ADP-ribose pyrophosphatase YjhB (NUDIX family)
MSFPEEIRQIADELREISSVGLRTAPNEYHTEKYEKMSLLSSRLVSVLARDRSSGRAADYQGDFSTASPMLVANAAVFRNGKILLIRRSDNGRWALPGGMTEVGETWAESAQRELMEEAGVRGTATKLLAVFDRTAPNGGQHLYIAVFMAEVPTDEEPKHDGAETTNVGFFPVEELPNVGATSMIPTVVKLARGEMPVPYFHPGPRQQVGS